MAMMLANHLWQSTLFAVAAALLALALRTNSAQTRYRIWLIASLKFLIPFSLLISAGSRLQWPVRAVIARPALAGAVQQIGQSLVAPVVFSSFPKPDVPTAASPIPAIVFVIWMGGVLAVLACWFRRWLQVRAIVRSSVPLPLKTAIPVLSSSARLEPGVFGVFRPVLLLPAGITGHLAPAHLEAILAHELCHVRRRDNLAASVQMLVEALFWFHPLVWWIGARLVEERERACDEEVLRLGNQPRIYAESILKTCQFYLESPLACVSGVTGSDLKKRVTRIMAEQMEARLNFGQKLLLAGAAITAVVLPLAVGLLNASPSRAHSNTPEASFEVASIKPTKPGTRGPMLLMRPGGKFTATGITTKFLLEEAYNVKDSQVSQAPPWFDSDRYDVEAKPEDSVGAALDKLPPDRRKAQFMQMLQSLLADRFKLQLSHDTKDLPIYALVIAKDGPKLHESTFKPPEKPADLPPVPQNGAPPPGGLWMQGPGHLTSTGTELAMLVNVLSRFPEVGRAVIDKTGLSGSYDFTLEWNAGPGLMGPGAPPEGAGAGAPAELSGPSLFTAIQEQLGLKLESQKAPLDVLVIQHVEKPSEN